METDCSINRSHVYFTSICRDVHIDHENGTLVGTSNIGQFISALPLTTDCNSFSLEIIDTGKRSIIAIGVCPRNYPASNLPGWKVGSVGYHADNGGIYVALGTAVKESEPCTDGDVMKCEVNFKNNSVLFYKNEKLIHTVDNLDSISNLHAAVGIYSDGETVRLLETRPWQKTRKVFLRLQRKFSDKEETVYHACISREVKICQSNGILTYIGDSENVPVGQFISASPLTPNCNSFSFEIVQPGKHRYIAIGVCPKTYPRNHQPGWTTGSFAYHADDGGIFMQYGVARRHKETCNEGDVMKCLIDFERGWIAFYKNDKQIHTIKHLPRVDNLHAAVGFHSVGEVVRLLEVKPWKMFDGIERDGRVWEKNTRSSVRCKHIYFTSICREVKVCHETGIVTYYSESPDIPVGQFISACPLTKKCNSFSFEIKDPGDNCYIAIGVCPKTYPPDRQPGWNRGSFAYHADDGGIFTGGGTTLKFKETCGAGDVMKCQVDFRSRCILFYKNNRLMGTIKNVSKVDNFHASIGFHSVGEEVHLLETEPWENIKPLEDDSTTDGSYSITEKEIDCTDSFSGSNNIIPSYWSIKRISKTTNYLVDIDSATKKSIENLVMNTFDSSLVGVGRDARHIRYSNIRILDIERVENPDLFEAYHLQRKLLRKKISDTSCNCIDVKNIVGSKGKIKTTKLLSDFMKDQLMAEINEHYLFHGTKESIVSTIIKSGLDFRLTNPACMFGRGIYASETFTKADQYTDEKDQRSDRCSRLHIFLTRMSLGNVFLCDEKHKTVAVRGSAKLNRPPCMSCHEDLCTCEDQVLYDSVMGDGRWLHREFVVYNNHQCYPEYLITYERV